jgi:hypothetical protein
MTSKSSKVKKIQTAKTSGAEKIDSAKKSRTKKIKSEKVNKSNKTGGRPKQNRGVKKDQHPHHDELSDVEPDSPQNYYCAVCRGRYGDQNDAKASDDWLECWKCHGSFHESCAEANGILDDDDTFTCRSCYE